METIANFREDSMSSKAASFESVVRLEAPLMSIGRDQFCVELSAEAASRLGQGKRIPVMAVVEGLIVWGNLRPRRGGGYRFYLATFLVEDYLDKRVGDLVRVELRPPEPHEPGGSKYQPYFLPGGRVRPVTEDSAPPG